MSEPTASAPLWFDLTKLQESNFNAEEYVSELRRYVPLESISTQLDTYLSQLRVELVEVINTKYNDFVGLAGHLSGVEGAITRIKKPLLDLAAKLQLVERGIESELQLLCFSLEHRQKLVNARRQLEKMQNAFQISMKIEKLLGEVQSAENEGLLMQSALLERAAQEVGKLDLLLSEESEVELMKQLRKQNLEFRNRVISQLEALIERAFYLKDPDHDSVLRLLNAFNVIGASVEGEKIFKTTLITPLFKNLEKGHDLEKFFETVLEQAFNLYSGLLTVLVKCPPGFENYCFLGNCVLSGIYDDIKRTRPIVFSPGNPDLFLHNYEAALYLLEKLESYCPTRAALDHFRSSPSVTQFLKEWNLPVYFAMRFQEIAGLLDDALLAEKSQIKAKHSQEVITTWTKCLQKCFEPTIFTEQLTDQFIKLFLKLLSRFEMWLKANISALKSKNPPESSSFPSSNEELASLENDLVSPMDLLSEAFYLEPVPEECKPQLQQIIESYKTRFGVLRMEIVDLICTRLVQECAVIVKKSVGTAVSTMFHPSGHRPTLPNDYIHRLLDPLRFFFESAMPRPDIQAQIKTAIAKGVCQAYRQALMDLLSFWEKSRMSLRRINKSRIASSSADTQTSEGVGQTSTNPTELANVYQQHWLDVSAFGHVLQEELELPLLEEYTELKDLIITKKEEEV